MLSAGPLSGDSRLRRDAAGTQARRAEFFGYTGDGPPAFNFRSRRNAHRDRFSEEEWSALGELLAKALALFELHAILKDAEPAYGEI